MLRQKVLQTSGCVDYGHCISLESPWPKRAQCGQTCCSWLCSSGLQTRMGCQHISRHSKIKFDCKIMQKSSPASHAGRPEGRLAQDGPARLLMNPPLILSRYRILCNPSSPEAKGSPELSLCSRWPASLLISALKPPVKWKHEKWGRVERASCGFSLSEMLAESETAW